MVRAAKSTFEKMIKVDHAGENGAVNIYRAQAVMAKLRSPSIVPYISEFQSHEETHRKIFADYLRKNNIRPCISYHVCGIGGYILGLITGLIGPKAVAATTYAVESVVLDHLKHQLIYLSAADPQAHACVAKVFEDEQEHHDFAAARIGQKTLMTGFIISIVKLSTEAVIRFGMR